jgi:hypothetical protein
VKEDLLALRRRELSQCLVGRVEQRLLEWSSRTRPLSRKVVGPPSRLLGERAERLGRLHPEPRQQAGQHVEPSERRARPAALDQQRPPLAVVGDEANGPVSAPAHQRVGLVLALAVGNADLEDGVATVGRPRR